MRNITRNCTSLCVKALALSIVALGLAVWTAKAEDVTVAKGSSAKLAIPDGVKKVTIANPNIIDAKPAEDGRAVLVSGLAEGSSALTIETVPGGASSYKIIVRADVQGMLEEIKELLGDVEGLDVKLVGNKIVFKGDIATKSGYDKVKRIAEAYAGVILDMTTIDRKGVNKYVVDAILRDIGMEGVTARVVEDTVVLEGVVYSDAEKARAEEIAKQRMPKVTSFLKVQEVMIETDVQFVEISSDKSKDMGYNVLDSFQVSGTASGAQSAMGGKLPILFGVSASASAQIKALLGNGTGKIVAQPHLSTKSGETGNFQSGGTKYFQVSGTTSGDLKSVDYGVILKVKPTLRGRDRVLNEVTIEVSIPIIDPHGGGVLTLDKYNTACTALCKVGESLVLSGMTQQISSSDSSKTPLLGDIPLLNLFFSHKTSDKTRKDFVIVVTPQPLFPAAATSQPFGEERKKLLQETGGTN